MTEIDPLQHKAWLIIETAMAEAQAMGMTYDGAAALLVIQGFCRIEDNTQREEIIASLQALQLDTGP